MSHAAAARSARALPSTPALTGLLEALAFFRDPQFARRRFETYGNVFETTLLGQRTVFLRGEKAVTDLFRESAALAGWWPPSVRELLGPLSLANRSGEDHRARRRIVGQLFTTTALKRYSPAIVQLVEELVADLRADPTDRALTPLLRRFAFRVIATTVLGLGPADRVALFLDFETWTRGLFSLPLAWPGTPLARARGARQRLLRRLGSVLRQAQGAAAARHRRPGPLPGGHAQPHPQGRTAGGRRRGGCGGAGNLRMERAAANDMVQRRFLPRPSGACLALLMPLLLAAPARAGSAVAESIMGEAAARAQALRQVPAGATGIRTRCREISVRGDFRYRCTVRYTDPAAAPEATAPAP